MRADQEIHQALTHEGRRRLAWVNSSEDNDHFSRSLRVFEVGGYSYELYIPLLDRLGQRFPLRVQQSAAQIVQVSQVAGVRVRISQDELVDVVLAVERKRETQHVVILMLRGSVVEYLEEEESPEV